MDLLGNQIFDWPFRLRVPLAGPPSVVFSETTVSWTVKGILDRTMRFDPEVELEIRVGREMESSD